MLPESITCFLLYFPQNQGVITLIEVSRMLVAIPAQDISSSIAVAPPSG